MNTQGKSKSANNTDAALIRVAVVDDHPIIRSGIRIVIESEPDFEWVGEADTVKQAMSLLVETRPDAVVLDLWLGGNDGIEMIKSLRRLVPETALLCYTMHDTLLFGERAMRAGAAGFISKKEPLDEVLLALRAVYRGDRYMNQALMNTLLDGFVGGPTKDAHEALTDRELQVFRLLGQGLANPDIAGQLGLSVKTVNTHRENIKRKLGIRNAADLVRHAVLMMEKWGFTT